MTQPNTAAPAPSTVHDIPGAPKSFTSKALEIGSSLLQSSGPLKNFHAHMCGFAFPAQDHSRQLEGHFYVSSINEEVSQCLVFDSDRSDARLIAVEYVISSRLFATLPPEEKRLWHSHQYDVLSGSFMAPGLPSAAERPLLNKMINTYGKHWNLWQADRGDTLPLGLPQLMMVATGPGEWNLKLFEERDKRLPAPRAHQMHDILPHLKADVVLPGADDGKREHLSLQIASSHA